jgi:hypothetical protein
VSYYASGMCSEFRALRNICNVYFREDNRTMMSVTLCILRPGHGLRLCVTVALDRQRALRFVGGGESSSVLILTQSVSLKPRVDFPSPGITSVVHDCCQEVQTYRYFDDTNPLHRLLQVLGSWSRGLRCKHGFFITLPLQ